MLNCSTCNFVILGCERPGNEASNSGAGRWRRQGGTASSCEHWTSSRNVLLARKLLHTHWCGR